MPVNAAETSDRAMFSANLDSEIWKLALSGSWTTRHIAMVDHELRALEMPANTGIAPNAPDEPT